MKRHREAFTPSPGGTLNLPQGDIIRSLHAGGTWFSNLTARHPLTETSMGLGVPCVLRVVSASVPFGDNNKHHLGAFAFSGACLLAMTPESPSCVRQCLLFVSFFSSSVFVSVSPSCLPTRLGVSATFVLLTPFFRSVFHVWSLFSFFTHFAAPFLTSPFILSFQSIGLTVTGNKVRTTSK